MARGSKTLKQKASGAAHSNGRALIAVDPAYQQAIRAHERALPDLMPNYERICQDIAECWRVDEVKAIDNKAEAIRCYARQIHNHEAQTKWALVRVRAWHRIGEITRSVKTAPHGPGRGHKSRPGVRTPFPSKTAFLRDVGISRSRANLGEQISKIAMKEFEDCAAEGLAQGRAVGFEEMVNAVLRRHRLNPGVRTRPWSNNDEGLFGVEANGEKLSYAGRLYRMTKRLSEADRIIHITRVSRDLPERQWHPLLAWLFTDRQVANLLQDLSQLPIAEHEKRLRNLTKEVREASSVVDYAEVTKQAHERTRATTPARTKKAKRRKSGKRRHASETQAAHQRHA